MVSFIKDKTLYHRTLNVAIEVKETVVTQEKNFINHLVAMSFSGGSSQPKNLTWVSWIAGRFFTIFSHQESPYYPLSGHAWEFWPQLLARNLYLCKNNWTQRNNFKKFIKRKSWKENFYHKVPELEDQTDFLVSDDYYLNKMSSWYLEAFMLSISKPP